MLAKYFLCKIIARKIFCPERRRKDMKIIRLRAQETKLYRRTMRTRFPFRFGKASMTEMPIWYLRVAAETEKGTVFSGVAA